MALYLTKDIETVAFLYRWTQKSTGKWYEGLYRNGRDISLLFLDLMPLV